MTLTTIKKNAYAKINLSLEVLGKRADGYHEIASVMQLVGLHDTLTFEPARELTVSCDEPGLGMDKDNLVMRAAYSLQEAAGSNRGAHIRLEKRIPLAAGLAGGSSDAGATLLGLSELWGIQVAKEELLAVASRIGSDVPFFLDGPTALVEGRGERVTPVAPPPPMWAVLVCPSFKLPGKTHYLYETLAPHDITDGSLTRRLVLALQQGRYPEPALLFNAFGRASFAVFEGLSKIKAEMLDAGAKAVHLSGSGPTLFTLFPESEQQRAEGAYSRLKGLGLNAFLTWPVTG